MKMKMLIIVGIMILSLNFVLGEVLRDSTESDFKIEGSLVCGGSGTVWINYSANPIYNQSSFGSDDDANCYSPNGIDNRTRQPTNFCCPSSYECKINENEGGYEYDSYGKPIYSCIATPDIKKCADYKTPETCEADNSSVITDSFPDNRKCGIGGVFEYEYNGDTLVCVGETICKCKWEDGKCKANFEPKTSCNDSSNYSHGNCTWTSDDSSDWERQCEENGYIEINYTADWIGGVPLEGGNENTAEYNNCVDISTTIDCGEIIKLPFFNWINFILSLLIIGFIYYFKE